MQATLLYCFCAALYIQLFFVSIPVFFPPEGFPFSEEKAERWFENENDSIASPLLQIPSGLPLQSELLVARLQFLCPG